MLITFFALQDLQFYIYWFKRGMLGPLSYYRTTRARFEEEKSAWLIISITTLLIRAIGALLPAQLPPNLPVLFIYGTKDTTCPPSAVQNAHKFIPRLNTIALEDVGHWVMLEAPGRITSEVLQFLSSLGLSASQKSRM